MERGLTIPDMRRMQLGQVIDFCIEYNNREKRLAKERERQEKHGTTRKATAADVKAFFG